MTTAQHMAGQGSRPRYLLSDLLDLDAAKVRGEAAGYADIAARERQRRRAAPSALALEQRGGGAAPTPSVTRGESNSAQQAVNIDWLNCTFAAPDCSPADFIRLLSRVLGRPLSGVQSPGLFGFAEGIKLSARHGSVSSVIGSLSYGGELQRGKWLFQLTGGGCQFVSDWRALRDFLEQLDAKLTRVDLALDFVDGDYTVDDAVDMYAAGGFQLNGRKPKTKVIGDWVDGVGGRTIYVGKMESGKMLRVYEKGKQLGDAASDWTRFEVQLGNRDREISFDVLTDRDGFFAGCYPALASLVEAASRFIPTLRERGVVTLAHLFRHLKRCYGKAIHTAIAECGADYADLIQAVRVVGLPDRVPISSLAAGVDWSYVNGRMSE